MTTLDGEDESVLKSFRDLLSFFGAELQSHASIVLGIALLTFAIIQAWIQLDRMSRLTDGAYFSVLVGIMGALLVYEVGRLYVYGKFAASLITADVYAVRDAKKEWNTDRQHDKDHQWETLLDLSKANEIFGRTFKVAAKRWLPLFHGARVKFSVLVGVFVAGTILSYVLIFGRP